MLKLDSGHAGASHKSVDFSIGAGTLWQTLLALLLTCALAWLALRLLRASAGFSLRVPRGQALGLLARLPLGEGHTVYLVRAAGRYLLVGGAGGGLSLLAELTPAQAEEALQKDAAQPAPGLRELLRRRVEP